MKLKDYFTGKPKGTKHKAAIALNITATWLSLLISEKKHPSATLAIKIEEYTKKKVTRKELRPDIY